MCRPNAETLLRASHKNNSMKANNTQTVPLTGEQQHAIDTLCANLIDAEEHAQTAADSIVPEVANVETRPSLALQSFLAVGNKNPLDLADEARRLLIAIQKANNRFYLERFCLGWIHFVCVGAIPILQKKYALSGTLRKQNAAAKFRQAFDMLAEYFLSDSVTDAKSLNTAVKKLAGKIKPNEFGLATLKAFQLDAEATAEINGANAAQVSAGKKTNRARTRYPKDSEALNVLREGMRRAGTKAYSGDSHKAIMLKMITEPQSKWAARMLYGKLKGKASGQGREHTRPLDILKAADNWGKYLSAYIKDHSPKTQ